MTRQIWVFLLITVQALLLLFSIKSGFWKTVSFKSPSFRDIWTASRNDSIESGTHYHGFVDLDHKDFSWLKVIRNATASPKNYTTPTTKRPTIRQDSTTRSVEAGSRILFPTVNHKRGEIHLMIFVTTIPKSLDKRNLIRSTWGNLAELLPTQSNLDLTNATDTASYIFFMLGQTGDQKQDEAVEEEADQHGDIIRSSSSETYRNILTKLWFSFEWAQRYQPKYILKVDDDMYVRLPRYFSWLNEGKLPDKLYAGYVHYRAYIPRSPKNPHYVSRDEFRERFFPNYCAGPCYTFSGNLLNEFIELSKKVKKFRVEDAYLGLLARTAGVKPYDLGGKLFIWDRSLTKSVRKWSDERLSRVICLGDSLTPEAIKYIHERFVKIDSEAKQ